MKKVLLGLVLMVLISLSAFAQEKSLPSPQPFFTALIVDDINKSIEWYRTILGLEVHNKTELKDRGLAMANLKKEGIWLELIEMESAVSENEIMKDMEKPSRIQGIFKTGFLLPEFDKWIAFLEEADVDFHGSVVKDSNTGKRTVIIKDPDGNRIQFFEN